MIVHTEGMTDAQEFEARDIVNILSMAYPGHPWAVRVYDGGLFIKHLAFDGNWGMNLKFNDFSHDAAVLRRDVIRNAGEWLERAGLARGRYDADQEVGKVEGVPEKKTQDVKLVMPDGKTELRTAPRPQALK